MCRPSALYLSWQTGANGRSIPMYLPDEEVKGIRSHSSVCHVMTEGVQVWYLQLL